MAKRGIILYRNYAVSTFNFLGRTKSETQKREQISQCQNTKDNLKTLQENSRIKTNENGKIRYLTAEEIDQKKQSYIKLINEKCSK